MRKIFKNPIFYIILFALLLRLSSVFFALPYADVFGDELPHTITTFKILNAKSLILPFEFNHYLPPLYSYLLLPIYGLIGVLGLIFNVFVSLADFKEFVILYREWFLAPGRILSAFFGAGTVYLIYLFAKKLFNKKVALLSAFLLVINFLHVHESQISHVWVPVVFFIVFSAYSFYSLYLSGKRKWYLLSVLGLGLGYAMGQIGIIFYPFFLLVHYLHTKGKKFFNKNFIEANVWLLVILVLFTVLNFYTFHKHFYDAIAPIFNILGVEDKLLEKATWMSTEKVVKYSFLFNWSFMLRTIFYNSPIVFLFSILGAGVLLRKHKKDLRGVLLVGFPIFLLLFFSVIFYSFLCRYTLPVIPFMIILASYFVFWVYKKLFNNKFVLVFLIVLVSGYSLLASGIYSYKLLKPYTVSSGIEWVYDNIPSGSRVVSDIYLNNNKESIELLQKYNEYNWIDSRKGYLLNMEESQYPQPNYLLIDTNLTDVNFLPEEEKIADYALIFFYDRNGREGEIKKNEILDVFGKREKVISFYPKGEKTYVESLLNLEPHLFLKNILETRYIGPNVEIYRFIK